MNERDFIYWIQGYLELLSAADISEQSLNEAQINIIREHIALVLTKVTEQQENKTKLVQRSNRIPCTTKYC